jgi:hypothetical protein
VEITEDNRALVELHGACSSCSMSMMTMKAGVEEAIKKNAPQITGVEAVNMPDPETATPFGKYNCPLKRTGSIKTFFKLIWNYSTMSFFMAIREPSTTFSK